MFITQPMLKLLKHASCEPLPRFVDQRTPGFDLQAFKKLRRSGLIEAIDASADSGDGYLHPVITTKGWELLHREATESQQGSRR